jgi:hypothetical protein
MTLLGMLDTDPRLLTERNFLWMAKALVRYGATLSDQFAYRNEERYAFYVHRIKQQFGKQGCRPFLFKNCSRHKGYDAEVMGIQKRIYSSRRCPPVVLYQYWIGARRKSANNGYSLVVVLPSPRPVSRRRRDLLSAESPPVEQFAPFSIAELSLPDLFPEI